MFHHTQVVGNEQVGQSQLFLKIHQDIEDLGLKRDVESLDRHIGDDELRLQRQRACNPDTLPLSTRELVRKALGVEVFHVHHSW